MNVGPSNRDEEGNTALAWLPFRLTLQFPTPHDKAKRSSMPKVIRYMVVYILLIPDPKDHRIKTASDNALQGIWSKCFPLKLNKNWSRNAKAMEAKIPILRIRGPGKSHSAKGPGNCISGQPHHSTVCYWLLQFPLSVLLNTTHNNFFHFDII